MKKRIKQWYEINDEYEYRFNIDDNVSFKDTEGRIIHGKVIHFNCLAHWKVTEEKTGWWIFGNKSIKYEFIEPSYVIKLSNGNNRIFAESNLIFEK